MIDVSKRVEFFSSRHTYQVLVALVLIITVMRCMSLFQLGSLGGLEQGSSCGSAEEHPGDGDLGPLLALNSAYYVPIFANLIVLV